MILLLNVGSKLKHQEVLDSMIHYLPYQIMVRVVVTMDLVILLVSMHIIMVVLKYLQDLEVVLLIGMKKLVYTV